MLDVVAQFSHGVVASDMAPVVWATSLVEPEPFWQAQYEDIRLIGVDVLFVQLVFHFSSFKFSGAEAPFGFRRPQQQQRGLEVPEVQTSLHHAKQLVLQLRRYRF